MPLTTHERMQVRKYLGYPQVRAAASLHFGLPAPTQQAYLVEMSMDQLLPEAEDEVRALLTKLTQIEADLFDARERLAVASVDDLELRGISEGDTETDALERENRRWSSRLADMLGVPLNAYSEKFAGRYAGGGGASSNRVLNVKVR